jgi:hypothetical protein
VALKLECAFNIGEPSALNMWLHLLAARPDVLQPSLRCDLYGSALRVGEVARAIATGKKQFFTVEIERAYFHFSPLGAYGFALLQIARCIESTADADRWMGALVALPSFLHGRLYDEDYDFWQNARDPLEYQARNQPYGHLPTRSNGLPPPLEKMEIDISANPGRRELRKGLIEAVGSPMWLSSEFLRRMGLSEPELQSQRWLNAERLASGVMKLSVQGSPFHSANGEQGSLQDKVRDFVFRTERDNASPSQGKRSHPPGGEL